MKKTILILSLIIAAGCAKKTTTRDFTPVKINVGTTANDGTGDTLRLAMLKINTNFTAISNQFVLLQAMLTTSSNSLLTVLSASTNGLASTNLLNTTAATTSNALLTTMSSRDGSTSNALLTAVSSATNGLASTNFVNAGITSYSNTATTLLAAKAPIASPTFTGVVSATNLTMDSPYAFFKYGSGTTNLVMTNATAPILRWGVASATFDQRSSDGYQLEWFQNNSIKAYLVNSGTLNLYGDMNAIRVGLGGVGDLYLTRVAAGKAALSATASTNGTGMLVVSNVYSGGQLMTVP